MDVEKLIDRLKECGTYGFKQEECREAAEALAALQIELKAMRGAANSYKAENAKLQAELEKVKAERDAAVDCCSGYCASCLFVKDCAKHDVNDAAPTRWYYGDCEDWEWRGPQKEE